MNKDAEQAVEKLWKAQVAVEQGKIIEAMLAVGMELEWLEKMTMDEAIDIFKVRTHDLIKLVEGQL